MTGCETAGHRSAARYGLEVVGGECHWVFPLEVEVEPFAA